MREADAQDGRKGAIKVFTSADSRASISIVRVPMEGKNGPGGRRPLGEKLRG